MNRLQQLPRCTTPYSPRVGENPVDHAFRQFAHVRDFDTAGPFRLCTDIQRTAGPPRRTAKCRASEPTDRTIGRNRPNHQNTNPMKAG